MIFGAKENLNSISTEYAKDVIFKTKKESRTSRVSLSATTTTQLHENNKTKLKKKADTKAS